MKDLDFDELDRAIASALGGDSHVAAAVENDALETPEVNHGEATEVTHNETLAPASAAAPSISAHAVHSRMMPSNVAARSAFLPTPSTPAPSQPPTETDDVPASTPAQETPKRIIPHRSGRFMDVMHASQSSESRTIPRPVSPKPVSTPSQPKYDATYSSPSIITTDSVNDGTKAVINEPLVSPTKPMTSAASPVNTATTQSSGSLSSWSLQPRADESLSTSSIDSNLVSVGIETNPIVASVSPFIPNAKVEKRPLGSAAEDVFLDDQSPLPSDTSLAEPHIDDQFEKETPLPEELRDDLMAIESGVASKTTSETFAVGNEGPKVASEPQKASALGSAGPTSISRQYKEQPRTVSEDDESGAIFDPQTYHQPIEHPAKKSSGWGWVIAIVIIILLAVGVAVAAWFLGVLPVSL